jgi:hypothetical protein
VKDFTKVLASAILAILVSGIPLMASDYHSNELIVKFKSCNPQSAMALSVEDERPMVIAVDDADQALKELQSNEDIEYVEPNYIIEAEDVPNDWPYADQWNSIGFASAWQYIEERGSARQVVIAVVDSGVDLSHEQLADVLVPGYDFANNDATPEDDAGHGTKVTGIIGAKGNDGDDVAGVDWNLNIAIMPLKFMKNNGGSTTGKLSDAVEAIYYAVDQGASVINASWGFGSYSKSLLDAINYAKDHGILFITSAGNSGADNDSGDHYPSNYTSENIIAVAALDAEGHLAGFSNYGASSVDIAAPGVGITTTAPTNSYVYFASGTSFATPFVTAVAAMVLSQSASYNYDAARNLILNTATRNDLPVSSRGSLNAEAALQAVDGYVPSALSSAATGDDSDGGGGGGGGCLINVSRGGTGNYTGFIIFMISIVLFQARRRKDLE